MIVTAQLGTPLSQPGNVRPGFSFGGTVVWRGPFSPADLSTSVPGYTELVETGQTTGISAAEARQMTASDPSWWELH